MRRRARTAVAVAGAVAAVVVALTIVLALPVVSGRDHGAEGAPADEQVTEVPVSALGGLGLTGVLGTGLWIGLLRRPPDDP